MAVRRGILTKRTRINLTDRLPPGTTLTGEMLADGRLVAEKEVPVQERRERRDLDGNILYHATPDGKPSNKPAMEVVQTGTRPVESVREDVGNGMGYRNTAFRRSPEQRAEEEKRAARAAAREQLDALATELADAGLSPKDVIEAIKAQQEPRQTTSASALPKRRGRPPKAKTEAKTSTSKGDAAD